MATSTLKVTTVNMAGIPNPLDGGTTGETGMNFDEFAQAQGFADSDVIVLQEVLGLNAPEWLSIMLGLGGNDAMWDAIVAEMHEMGFYYISESSTNPTLMDSGVVILSRYPFVDQGGSVYEAGRVGLDVLGSKGFERVNIIKDGQEFAIYGTHLISDWVDEDPDNFSIKDLVNLPVELTQAERALQVAELQADMDQYQDTDVIVVLAGDMNIGRNEDDTGVNSEEYDNGIGSETGRWGEFNHGEYSSKSNGVSFIKEGYQSETLDHIMVDQNGGTVYSNELTVLGQDFEGEEYTDHKAVSSVITFEARPENIVEEADEWFIFSAQANDVVVGNSLDNFIISWGLNSRIYGDDGNDKIYGGKGNDFIAGGSGNDVITGGGGDDIFIFSDGDGHDVIKDFDTAWWYSSEDTLLISVDGITSNADLLSHAHWENGNMVIEFDANNSLTLEGISYWDFKFIDTDFI